MSILTLKNYRYGEETPYNITDWSLLIEKLMNNIGWEQNNDYKLYVDKLKTYYLAKNPFGDGGVMSCMLHTRNGNMRIYNSSLPIVVRGGKKVRDCSITISEYSRLFDSLEFSNRESFDDYIDFILQHYNISGNIFNQYKKSLFEEKMNEMNVFKKPIQSKGYYEFRRFLFVHFITDNDVMKIGKRSTKIIKFDKVVKSKAEEKPKPQINNPSVFCKMVVDRYLKKRDLIISELIEPVEIIWNGGQFINYGINIKYQNGFRKIRLIDNNKLRYFADGKYEEFLYVRKDSESKELYLVEGEFEAITIAKYIQDDIFAMHNINSLPSDLTILDNYDKINIRIDYDNEEKFNEVKEMFESKITHKNLEIKPKFLIENGKIDYNFIHCNYGLSPRVIQNPDESLDFLRLVKFVDKK